MNKTLARYRIHIFEHAGDQAIVDCSIGSRRVMAVDSRERTFLALEHETGDRIPVDFWASRSMIHKLERSLGMLYERFLDRHDVDPRYGAWLARGLVPPIWIWRCVWKGHGGNR